MIFRLLCVLSVWSFSVCTWADTESELVGCPFSKDPFSVDLPLSDVVANDVALKTLLKLAPNASAIIDSAKGEGGLPLEFLNIVTPRSVLSSGWAKTTPENIAAIDDALRRLPITEHDQIQRCARYDVSRPEIPKADEKPLVLVFDRVVGYRHGDSIIAANKLLAKIAGNKNWQLLVTDKAGVFNPDDLAKVDLVVWNNTSGDLLTVDQRAALRDYIETGGGFVGLHAAGGDPVFFWDWYVDTLIGARFIGHPGDPQIQQAKVIVEQEESGLSTDLVWLPEDEWYSFSESPRKYDSDVLLRLDESTYRAIGYNGEDLTMGDHPIAWRRCVDQGRSFYSALGHQPEVYADHNFKKMLQHNLTWAMNGQGCSTREKSHE